MLNAVLPIVLVVTAVVGIYLIGLQNSYLTNMRAGLEDRARIAADNFSGYGMKSYSEYYRYATVTAETFEDKDSLELQFINSNGRVQVSSYGLTAGTSPGTDDISQAIATGQMKAFHGLDPQTEEEILSVSHPLLFNSRVVGVLRYVTSLEELHHRLMVDGLIACAAGLLCIALTILTNAVFINRLIEPVTVVSDAARRISGGSYGTLIDNRYRDEMRELVDNINDMSIKISQAERIQQEFISSVSHELRTPLTAINGWAETLAADPTGDSEQIKRGLGVIINESRRLTGMVEELLDFTRIQDGRFTLRVESTDLAAVLEDAIFTYRELLRQEGIELHYACDENIPLVVADGERMKQVFCNLLDNAAKHGGAGKQIDVAARWDGTDLFISVRDHGHGIPPEELPFVKQKFYKGSAKARGSGIGLAVCDEIVQLHGGTLEIKNAPDGGTEAVIQLPLK